jgi:hypothetical protein
MSHLHQIGVAVHNYESTYGAFPGLAGSVEWRPTLLSFLEQPPDARTVPILGCPSDEFGTGRVCYQINDGLWQRDHNGFARVDYWTPVRTRDIVDGLSNTAAFAEKLAWPDVGGFDYPPEAFPEYWIRRIRNTAAYIADMDAFADQCRDDALLPPRTWEFYAGYNHVLTPNQNSCYNGPRTGVEHFDFWAITSTSQHPGGVLVLYADGGVRFTSDFVDRPVWRAVGTRNGGEAITADR